MSLVALLALLTTWIVTSGGGGGNNGDADGSNGKNPASSITPGPTGSGPAISEAPGGRDESGEESGGSGGSEGSGGGDGSGDLDGGSVGSGGTDGSSGGAGGAGGGSAGVGGGGVFGDTVPAGSGLPNCTPGAVKLTLRSVQNTYSPAEQPELELIVANSSATDCKLDLGPREAVLTITQAGGDEMWSSADCPTGAGSVLYRVPAKESVTRTLEWDRKASAPQCATPPADTASAGTYLVEATAPGLATARTSFVLAKD